MTDRKNKEILKLQKKHSKERESQNESRKDKSIEWNERLDKIAFILSKKFSYSKLVSAIDGKSGFEVHGFMQNQFFDYVKLFRDNVLDRACFFAKRDYTPEVIKLIDMGVLKDWHRSIHELESPYTLGHYPNFPYSKYIIYSKDPFEEAVKWIDGFPFSIKGYNTYVTLAPCNIALLGWASWDLPIFILTHAVGKNQSLFKITTEAEEIDREMKAILKKIIHSQRAYIDTSNDKIAELIEFSRQHKKMYDDLKNKILSNAPMIEEADFVRYEQEYLKKQRKKGRHRNWKMLGIWSFVGIIAVAAVLISIRVLFGG